MVGAKPGRIVFLNGTSSSGKSSIAEELLVILDGPYFHMSIDAINSMRAKERTAELSPADLAEVLARTRAGFHRAFSGMARAGNDLVVDYVLSEPWRLLDCLGVTNGLDVIFVGVHCDADELERRERTRGDRPVGLAASQLRQVHAHRRYDIDCDTTRTSASDCAAHISDAIQTLQPQRAFDLLRAQLVAASDLDVNGQDTT